MPIEVAAYAAPTPGAPLVPTTIARRDLGPRDVLVDIQFAGICHSDIHQARDEWFSGLFPMVPGHEIAGIVSAVGSEVSRFAVGDRAGVGVFVDSCRECESCRAGLENYCSRGFVPTYNGREYDGEKTYGGYSTGIVVHEDYVLRIPDALGLDEAAPLLCAGITTFSPLREFGAGPGVRVGVMGLGGLGHMGVKIAAAMGADVTLISHSPSKEEDGRRLGANHFLLGSDERAMKEARESLDLIVNTVSAPIDMDAALNLLKRDGTLVSVGLPDKPVSVSTFTLIAQRRRLAGSNIGGIRQTQEMLDFCAEHGLGADIETIRASEVNTAWDRVVQSAVRYRVVIDATTI